MKKPTTKKDARTKLEARGQAILLKQVRGADEEYREIHSELLNARFIRDQVVVRLYNVLKDEHDLEARLAKAEERLQYLRRKAGLAE